MLYPGHGLAYLPKWSRFTRSLSITCTCAGFAKIHSIGYFGQQPGVYKPCSGPSGGFRGCGWSESRASMFTKLSIRPNWWHNWDSPDVLGMSFILGRRSLGRLHPSRWHAILSASSLQAVSTKNLEHVALGCSLQAVLIYNHSHVFRKSVRFLGGQIPGCSDVLLKAQ